MAFLKKIFLFLYIFAVVNPLSGGWIPTALSDSTSTIPANPPIIYSSDSGQRVVAAWITNSSTTGTLNYNIFTLGNWSGINRIDLPGQITGLSAVIDNNFITNTTFLVLIDNSSLVVMRNGSLTTLETGTLASPKIATTEFGDLCAVWIANNGTTDVVRASYFNGSWSTPSTLSLSVAGRPASEPDVVFAGSPRAVWTYFNGTATVIQRSSFIPPSNWSAPLNASSNTPGFVAAHPRIAGTSSNSALAIWQLNNGSATVIQAAIIEPFFGSATTLSASTAGALSINPRIDVDSLNNGAAVWQRSNGAHFYIQGAFFNGTSWSSAADLTSSSATLDGSVPVVAIEQGNAVAIWQQATTTGSSLQATSYNATVGWVTPPELFATRRNPTNPAISSGTLSGSTLAYGAWQFNDIGPTDVQGGTNTSFNSRLSANPTSVPADGTTSSTLTLLAKDSSGTPQSGVSLLQVVPQQPGVTVTPNFGATNGSGIALFSTTSTQGRIASYHTQSLLLTSSTYGSTLVTFEASVDPSTSSVVADPTIVAADGISTSTITVTLLNTTGTPAQDKEVALAPDGGSSVISPTTAFTNSLGQTIFSVSDTAIETVTYTATDITDGLVIPQTTAVTFEQQASQANSTVVASPTMVAANGTAFSQVVITLLDHASAPVPGKMVSLTPDSGSSVVTVMGSDISDANGKVTFQVTDLVPETVTYTALDVTDGIIINQPAPAQITFTQVTSATNSSVSAAPTSVGANGTPSTITVTLRDSANNPIAGKLVSLAANMGNSLITPINPTSNVNGVATFQVSDTTPEAVTYTASVAIDAVTIKETATVTFVQVPNPGTSLVEASPTNVRANGVDFTTITVTLLDLSSQPVSGKTVTLSQDGNAQISPISGVSDANGQVFFTATNLFTETVTFTATDTTDNIPLSQPALVNFTQDANPATSTFTASPTQVSADGVSFSTFDIQILDYEGNPIPNASVLVEGIAANSSIIQPTPPQATDSLGSVQFMPRDTVQESITYRATVLQSSSSVILNTTQTVNFIYVVDGNASTVTASPTSVNADGTSISQITVTLLTINGVPVENKTVSLQALSGSAIIAVNPIVTNSNGQAVFSVTDSVAETVNFRAVDTTDNIIIKSTASVTFLPYPDVNASTVIAFPATVAANGIASSTITVRLLSAVSQPVPNKTMMIIANSGNSVITPISPVTDINGVATFKVTNINIENVTYTAVDSTDNLTITQTANVDFFTNISPTFSTVETLTPIVPANGISTATITVTLRDLSGLPVEGEPITLVATNGSSIISAPSGFTDANGQVFFTVKNSVVETVTYVASDPEDGVTLTQTVQVSFVAPKAPTAFVGKVIKNKFLNKSELTNVLNWLPTDDSSVVSYELYQDGILILTIPKSGPFEVILRNRVKDQTYIYNLFTVNAAGIKSTPKTITLP
jgi:hypothetical protein